MNNNALSCGHDHCGACCGSSCKGCGRELELTQKEVDLLYRFAQIPFLPVAKQSASSMPIYLEDGVESAEAYGIAITALNKKQLIHIDYELPLLNFNYAEYKQYPYKGSMALTVRGQAVVELLEIQGIVT